MTLYTTVLGFVCFFGCIESSLCHGLSPVVVWRLLAVVVFLIAEHKLYLELSSVIVVHRLSCFMAYGIFPDQGSNPGLLYWLEISLTTHWSTREVPVFGVFKSSISPRALHSAAKYNSSGLCSLEAWFSCRSL